MSIKTIFYSYSGITRGIAEKIHAECGGELIEVEALPHYSTLTAYSKGCYRAIRGESDVIKPSSIDVSRSSLIVIGTPVWALRATPAINAAVEALKGCEGKTAILFATCGGEAKDTLPLLAKALAEKDVEVTEEFVFDKNDVRDAKKIDDLIAEIKAAGAVSHPEEMVV